MKYIIVEDMGLEQAIVFSEIIKHSDVARMLPVISAGFCSIYVSCWGHSLSLNKKSRGEVDKQVILKSISFSV